jgi:carbon storage regulator CsrA
MLIITLKENEKVLIGNDISVKEVKIRRNQISLGSEAPAGLLREKTAGKTKA